MRVLVLGGTTEASSLARLAAGTNLDVVLSLAGRTAEPKPLPVPTRTGGFGGPDGLARWLVEAGIDAVVDATHPFAAQISRNAAAACLSVGVPLVALRRPPWRPVAGDRWIEAADMPAAAAALGAAPRRVFLTVGRLELAPFAAFPQHTYVVRTIEPIGDALRVPHRMTIRDRGPFDLAGERALLERERIEVLVTKNSGGEATYPKLAAARALGVPVVMVRRPDKPAVAAVGNAGEALAWLRSHSRPP